MIANAIGTSTGRPIYSTHPVMTAMTTTQVNVTRSCFMEMLWMTNHVALMFWTALAYGVSRGEPVIRHETFATHARLAAHIRPSIKRLRGAIGRHFARL